MNVFRVIMKFCSRYEKLCDSINNFTALGWIERRTVGRCRQTRVVGFSGTGQDAGMRYEMGDAG